MKKLIFILFMFLPCFAYAETYEGIGGFFQMIGDFFDNIWEFFFTDIPNLIQRALAYFIVWATKAKIYAMYEFMKFSWQVAEIIIQDLNIMSQITAQVSLLPPDVRQAFIDMRLFDGINLLLNAYMTKFVMNFIR
jgi:hypothetical protein